MPSQDTLGYLHERGVFNAGTPRVSALLLWRHYPLYYDVAILLLLRHEPRYYDVTTPLL